MKNNQYMITGNLSKSWRKLKMAILLIGDLNKNRILIFSLIIYLNNLAMG